MDEHWSDFVINQDEKTVITDLQDALFVHSLLQHDTDQQASSNRQQTSNKPEDTRSEWHRFLDSLCFLCDSRRAGKSVVAIGVEERVSSNRFWITTTPFYQDDACDHLRVILSILQRSLEPDSIAGECVDEIVRISVERSTQRVLNYMNRLRKTSQSVRSHPSPDVHLIFDEIDKLTIKHDCHLKTCDDAHEFAQKPVFALLEAQRHSSQGDTWKMLRHFVGRLGYWRKAAAFVVRTAQTFAVTIRSGEVASIPRWELSTPSGFRLDDNLGELVLRVFPELRGSAVLRDLSNRIERAEGLIDWFRSNNIMIPKPHAEVIVLDHFHRTGAEFVNNDRYIGCSKPSCHCCALYFEYHPGRFLPRPAHGNTWLQWCLPQTPSDTRTLSSDLGILRRMANRTRDLTHASLTNRLPLSRRRFESTTGITSMRLERD